MVPRIRPLRLAWLPWLLAASALAQAPPLQPPAPTGQAIGQPPTREALRIVVRSESYASSATAAWAAGARPMQPRPLVPGLVVLPVLDSPRTLKMLAEADNQRLGLSADEVHALALRNTRAALRPVMEIAKPARMGEFGHLGGDYFHPSRLAFHDTWAPLVQAQDGTLIVAAPATDGIVYVGEDSPAAIDALRTLTRNLLRRVPNPLSDVLLRWRPEGWEVVR